MNGANFLPFKKQWYLQSVNETLHQGWMQKYKLSLIDPRSPGTHSHSFEEVNFAHGCFTNSFVGRAPLINQAVMGRPWKLLFALWALSDVYLSMAPTAQFPGLVPGHRFESVGQHWRVCWRPKFRDRKASPSVLFLFVLLLVELGGCLILFNPRHFKLTIKKNLHEGCIVRDQDWN